VAAVRGGARRGPVARRRRPACADRRTARPRRRPLRARRPRRAGGARVRGLGCLHAAPEAVARPACTRGGAGARAVNVDQAYAEVERVTRREAKNFAYGIMVLPREKRRAIDDVADGDLPFQEKRARLEALRASLDEPPTDATSIALADARGRFGIPRDALSAL